MSEAAVPVTALAPVEPHAASLPIGRVGMTEILFDPARFEHAQRVAKMLINSPLVPDHIRGKSVQEGIANVVMALALAAEMRENPIVVMQNIYFVSGKAGWLTQYMIAKAAKAGVFRGPVRWRTAGKGKDMAVTAYATLSSTGETVEITADMKMAIAEGWTKNKKYESMPEHMLSWRSATMLVRRYCPQVMLGLHTQDELEDVRAAEVTAGPGRRVVESSTGTLLKVLDVQDAELEPEPAAEAPAEPEPAREPGED